MEPLGFDPLFVKFCYWLSFMALLEFVVCLPLITFFLWLIAEHTRNAQKQFRREQNRIAEELEKLRSQLETARANVKGQ